MEKQREGYSSGAWRTHGQLRWDKWRPRLVLHERYEKPVKWGLRGLTAAGIVTAALSMGPVAGVALAIAQLGMEQFLERAVFQYTTFYVQPFPHFDFDMKDLTGMGFVWIGETPLPEHADTAAFAFASRDLAVKFFELLGRWNYQQVEDKDDNIQLSFVWAKDQPGYYVCLNPNPARETVKAGLEQMKGKMAASAPAKEQQGRVLMWAMRKLIGDGPGDNLRKFAERQSPGRPFYLAAMLMVEGQEPQKITEVKPILKWHFRVVNEKDLTKKDREYSFMKM